MVNLYTADVLCTYVYATVVTQQVNVKLTVHDVTMHGI